jgi:hypothetical protein
MNQEERDLRIAKHVDAVRALIRPSWVLAIFAVDREGRAYFIAPAGYESVVNAALAGYSGLTQIPPEST